MKKLKNILILSKFYKFAGPINLQGFIKNNKVKFTELNKNCRWNGS